MELLVEEDGRDAVVGMLNKQVNTKLFKNHMFKDVGFYSCGNLKWFAR